MMSWVRNTGNFNDLLIPFETFSRPTPPSQVPWSEKIPKALWRGSSTGGPSGGQYVKVGSGGGMSVILIMQLPVQSAAAGFCNSTRCASWWCLRAFNQVVSYL